MASLTLVELKGTVDFGIITIRSDEYEAVLQRFPGENNADGERNYRISDVPIDESGTFIRVAVVRCTKQGQAEAQSVANDMINDLDPECLLAVGIAGGIRDNEFSLGDVVVATRIHDFSADAVHKDGTRAFDLGGGDIPKSLQNILVSLKSYEQKLGDWGSDVFLSQVPPVNYEDPQNYYGPNKWRDEVQKSLEKHFGVNVKRRSPKVVDGPVASSDRLIKNVEITEQLLSAVRSTKAVEMEVGGVYHAARKGKKKDYQFTTIRGISDIIGFERDDGWTKYACQSAAAFTYAFVKSGIFITPKPLKRILFVLPPDHLIGSDSKLGVVRQEMQISANLLGEAKGFLSGNVNVADCNAAIQNIHQVIEVELLNVTKILKIGDEKLLQFHAAFLFEFGPQHDKRLKPLLEKVKNFRDIKTDRTDIQSDIQHEIGEIIQNIKTLIAQHLN